MLKNLHKNRLKIAVAAAIVFLLALVRIYEHALFYDPFASYFNGEYLNLDFPKYEGWHLFFSMLLRYVLNSTLSIGIIYVLFRDIQLVKFASLLYIVFFLLLITAFFALLEFSSRENNFIIFYVRRFLIQPIFVLLFIPAFYYQKLVSKK